VCAIMFKHDVEAATFHDSKTFHSLVSRGMSEVDQLHKVTNDRASPHTLRGAGSTGVLVVVGNKRSGKSTLIDTLLGNKMVWGPQDTLVSDELFAAQNKLTRMQAKVRSSSISIYPKVAFPKQVSSLGYCDAGSFSCPRGPEYNAVGGMFMRYFLEKLDVFGFLLVIEEKDLYPSSSENRGYEKLKEAISIVEMFCPGHLVDLPIAIVLNKVQGILPKTPAFIQKHLTYISNQLRRKNKPDVAQFAQVLEILSTKPVIIFGASPGVLPVAKPDLSALNDWTKPVPKTILGNFCTSSVVKFLREDQSEKIKTLLQKLSALEKALSQAQAATDSLEITQKSLVMLQDKITEVKLLPSAGPTAQSDTRRNLLIAKLDKLKELLAQIQASKVNIKQLVEYRDSCQISTPERYWFDFVDITGVFSTKSYNFKYRGPRIASVEWELGDSSIIVSSDIHKEAGKLDIAVRSSDSALKIVRHLRASVSIYVRHCDIPEVKHSLVDATKRIAVEEEKLRGLELKLFKTQTRIAELQANAHRSLLRRVSDAENQIQVLGDLEADEQEWEMIEAEELNTIKDATAIIQANERAVLNISKVDWFQMEILAIINITSSHLFKDVIARVGAIREQLELFKSNMSGDKLSPQRSKDTESQIYSYKDQLREIKQFIENYQMRKLGPHIQAVREQMMLLIRIEENLMRDSHLPSEWRDKLLALTQAYEQEVTVILSTEAWGDIEKRFSTRMELSNKQNSSESQPSSPRGPQQHVEIIKECVFDSIELFDALLDQGYAPKVTYQGSPPFVCDRDIVSIEYTAYIVNSPRAVSFESSKEKGPWTFSMRDPNIPEGLRLVVKGLGVGARFEVVLSPEKAYGTTGHESIPPNSHLMYAGTIIDIKADDGSTQVLEDPSMARLKKRDLMKYPSRENRASEALQRSPVIVPPPVPPRTYKKKESEGNQNETSDRSVFSSARAEPLDEVGVIDRDAFTSARHEPLPEPKHMNRDAFSSARHEPMSVSMDINRDAFSSARQEALPEPRDAFSSARQEPVPMHVNRDGFTSARQEEPVPTHVNRDGFTSARQEEPVPTHVNPGGFTSARQEEPLPMHVNRDAFSSARHETVPEPMHVSRDVFTSARHEALPEPVPINEDVVNDLSLETMNLKTGRYAPPSPHSPIYLTPPMPPLAKKISSIRQAQGSEPSQMNHMSSYQSAINPSGWTQAVQLPRKPQEQLGHPEGTKLLPSSSSLHRARRRSSSVTVTDDLAELPLDQFLARAHLQDFEDALCDYGVEDPGDITCLTRDELKGIGMSVIQIRKLNKLLSAIGHMLV